MTTMLTRCVIWILFCVLSTNAAFHCFSNPVLKRLSAWQGAVKASATYLLHHSVDNWTLEIHFDRTITKLEQWYGIAGTPHLVLQRKKKIFFIQQKAWSKHLPPWKICVYLYCFFRWSCGTKTSAGNYMW